MLDRHLVVGIELVKGRPIDFDRQDIERVWREEQGFSGRENRGGGIEFPSEFVVTLGDRDNYSNSHLYAIESVQHSHRSPNVGMKTTAKTIQTNRNGREGVTVQINIEMEDLGISRNDRGGRMKEEFKEFKRGEDKFYEIVAEISKKGCKVRFCYGNSNRNNNRNSARSSGIITKNSGGMLGDMFSMVDDILGKGRK